MLPENKTKEVVDYHVRQIRQITEFEPDIAIVLGSGLGAVADQVDQEAVINYGDLLNFPISTISGHAGRFVFGRLNGVKVVIMQGRMHYYEGYTMHEVVLPLRVMESLGAKVLLLTNASGGINPSFSVGDFMMITDQISLFLPSPLIGRNSEEMGPRFPSMNNIYDKKLCELIEETAAENGIDLKKGVFVQTTGPQYESPAEVRMLRMLGADAVAMSTAVEAVAAVHLGMRVCGISCITNIACMDAEHVLTHDEVKETADRVAEDFQKLVTGFIEKAGKAL